MALRNRVKRLLIGPALVGEQRVAAPVRRRVGIPAFASDTVSSNVYAVEEILGVLAAGGLTLYAFGPWLAAAVMAAFVLVVAAYRQLVLAYPGGGGDYEAARARLGDRAAALAASAMIVDFAMTLAVSAAAASANAAALWPWAAQHRVGVAIGMILLLALLNLRGLRESTPVLVALSYAFVAAVLAMTAAAVLNLVRGEPMQAVSANWSLQQEGSLTALAVLLLIAKAFSSGSVAMTGVEAIGTAAPAFRPPRGRNAAVSLVALGAVSMTVFGCLVWLAEITGVRVAVAPQDLISEGGSPPTLLAQVADAVLGGGSLWAGLVVASAVLILFAAGNSAFRSFSALASRLGRDGFLPRQLGAQGDRLVHSNGILVLAVAAVLTVAAGGASVAALVQVYVVGVFLALSLGQAAMVEHWRTVLGRPATPADHARARRRLGLARVGAVFTVVVLVVAVVSKFTSGAWLVVVIIPLLYQGMITIRRHYDRVQTDLAAPDETVAATFAGPVTALVLVSRIHRPTLRAVAYARATRPSRLEAITVALDEQEAAGLREQWQGAGLGVPLRVLPSPFREIDTPIFDFVEELRRSEPDGLLTIYIPEYLVSRWWEKYLHNQSAARLKSRLVALPNVSVVSVPWQLRTPTEPSAAGSGAIGV